MNVVAYGGGTNSTAMLIGMHQRSIPVDLILFVDAAKLLLDRGMDFEQYRLWAEDHDRNCGHEDTLEALAEHWAESLDPPNQDSPAMGGMVL